MKDAIKNIIPRLIKYSKELDKCNRQTRCQTLFCVFTELRGNLHGTDILHRWYRQHDPVG
jgi:hypothetical protein